MPKATAKLLLLGLIAASCAGCGAKGPRHTQKRGAQVHHDTPRTEERTTSTISAADHLWSGRQSPEKAKAALRAYKELLGNNPSNLLVVAKYLQAAYFVGHYIVQEGDEADEIFLDAVRQGENAQDGNAAYQAAFAQGNDELGAISALPKEYIDIVYWVSANLGRYAATKNLLVRLSYKAKLEAYNKWLMSVDPTYNYGAAHRFWGALLAKLPGGDLDQSREHFLKAIAIAPNCFSNRILYAYFYATKVQDRALYTEQLRYVLDTAPNGLPEIAPENAFDQVYAKKLLDRTDELF